MKPILIERIGMEVLVQYEGNTENLGDTVLTPSDHFGLYCEIGEKEGPRPRQHGVSTFC